MPDTDTTYEVIDGVDGPNGGDGSSFYQNSTIYQALELELDLLPEIIAHATSAAINAAAAFERKNAAAVSAADSLVSQTAAASSAAAALANKNASDTNATNAASSAASALANKNASDTNATSAASSAASALANKNASDTNATNAASSAAAALVNKNASDTNATNAGNSATNAGNSAAAATSSASAALTSKNNAATSETNAASSAATATTQAGIATTKATNASTSATNAATSETNSATSASQALASKNAAATSEANAASSLTTLLASARPRITAARTYYVRTDGNDGNTGLTNAAGGAFLTIQKAVDTVASLDLSTYQATIQIVDGTYTAVVALRPYLGTLPPIIKGNTTTPANVLVSTGPTAFVNAGAGIWQINDLKIVTSVGNGLQAGNGGTIRFQNIDFGAIAAYQMFCGPVSSIVATGNYSVSGGAQYHVAANGLVSIVGLTVNYNSLAIAYSGANILAGRGAVVDAYSITFSGAASVTGKRYDAQHNGIIFTIGAGANYFPGSVAGTTATGGQYL